MTVDAEQLELATCATNVDTILHGLTGNGTVVFIALLDDQSLRPVVARPDPDGPAFPGTSTVDLILISAHVKAYNEVVQSRAVQYGATTVDFYKTTIFTDATTLCGDGNHPNQAGYDRVAQIWFEALRQRLGSGTE